ncbi:ABC transporter permease [Streptomyces sp. 4F14]|uniref:ABC transporter permease n=1 Tax=Streptomyces sp. 4F14 TaxID=3394380 RepID=UPI003A8C837C
MTRLVVLVRHKTLLMLRETGPLLSRLILPLVFLTLLRPLYVSAQGPQAGTEQAVISTLVTFSFLALSLSGSAILTERLARTWDRLRSTPLHPAELLAGKSLPVLAALLTQQILIIAAAVYFFALHIPHPPPGRPPHLEHHPPAPRRPPRACLQMILSSGSWSGDTSS